MKQGIPRTPFSTPLSKSARETELRLKNIFSGPKKRPPALFLALVFSVCVLCGNLVSCQEAGLPPPDLSVAPVDLGTLPIPEPVYTLEDSGDVLIEGLGDVFVEWNHRSTGNILYFAGNPAFCCPSLAGRTAEGSAHWQDEELGAISVSMNVNDGRLEDGTVDGWTFQFVVDWAKEKVLESSFTSAVGDGTLELSEDEMLYAGRVLWRLMVWAEWRATADVTNLDAAPDLNRNGIPEELRLYVPNVGGTGQRLEVWEDGQCLWTEEGDQAHVGWNAVFLCTLDGEDFLLRYNPYMGQGIAGYGYDLYTLEGGDENIIRENGLYFEINFGMPTPDGGVVDPAEMFDPEEIAAFMDEVNGLLSHSVQLLNTDQNLLATFEREGRLEDTLGFLDDWEPVFTRDPEKTLLENLRDFRDIMGRHMTEGRRESP